LPLKFKHFAGGESPRHSVEILQNNIVMTGLKWGGSPWQKRLGMAFGFHYDTVSELLETITRLLQLFQRFATMSNTDLQTPSLDDLGGTTIKLHHDD
jgi:hypothetical protein